MKSELIFLEIGSFLPENLILDPNGIKTKQNLKLEF